jgi:uncharacterized membrane protein YuzA (DUF378 family)
MRKIDIAALILAIVGALNWGLVAIGSFDLVAKVFGMDFGETNAITRVIYGLVGLSGLWLGGSARRHPRTKPSGTGPGCLRVLEISGPG